MGDFRWNLNIVLRAAADEHGYPRGSGSLAVMAICRPQTWPASKGRRYLLLRCTLLICTLHAIRCNSDQSSRLKRWRETLAASHVGEEDNGRSTTASGVEAAHLHGDHHPPVSIKFGDPALVYKFGESGLIHSMEVHAWIDGCVEGLDYLVSARELVDSPDEARRRIWEQPFSVLGAKSSFHVRAVFLNPQPRLHHRFVVQLVDTYAGLEANERMLAAREAVIPAPLGESTKALQFRSINAFLGPIEVVPPHLVTLVTQCSIDRLPRLEEQAVALGNAPISVAIFLDFAAISSQEKEQAVLNSIHTFHRELVLKGSRRVTISLLYGNTPAVEEYDNLYPINNLRNLALDAATTELVLLVDVDFVPSPELALLCNAANTSASNLDKYRDMCKCGAVLVVATFEVAHDLPLLPRTKSELARLRQQKRADIVQIKECPTCHAPTNVEYWFATDSPYLVQYQKNYEPFIIARREGLPRYDERFRGYHKDKISYLHELAAKGAVFAVLPEVFLTGRKDEFSPTWERVSGENRNPLHLMRVAQVFADFTQGVRDKGYDSDWYSAALLCVGTLGAGGNLSDKSSGTVEGERGSAAPHTPSRPLGLWRWRAARATLVAGVAGGNLSGKSPGTVEGEQVTGRQGERGFAGLLQGFHDSFSGGGMTASEQQLLATTYSEGASVFEWGMGSSTLIAEHLNVTRLTAVDNSLQWVSQVQDSLKRDTAYRLVHVNVGPILDWGRPASEGFIDLWPDYSTAVDMEADPFDVYLVDGRFRVACACRALLHAHLDARVLVHDFHRPEYHSLLHVAEIVSQVGSLAILRTRSMVTHSDLERMWKDNIFEWL